MGVRLNVVTLLSSLALFACSGASHRDAKGPEADPWADYKGTYATAAGASGSPAARVKAAQPVVAKTDTRKEVPVEVADATPAVAPAATPVTLSKKAKVGTAAKVSSKAKKKK